MKLTVVGCAPAYSTRPGRSSSCYLVQEADTAVVLDLGQGGFSELWRYTSPAKVTAVVISHMHADHNVDLVPLRHWARYGNRRVGPALFGPTDLRPRFTGFQHSYGEPTTETDFLSDLPGGILEEGAFAVGNLLIEARRVTHIPDSFAFRVSARAGGAGLVYSGDCGMPDDLVPLVRRGDTLLCEAGFGVVRDFAGVHLTAGEAASVARLGEAARLVLTHLHDRADADRIVLAARSEFAGDISLAEPGMKLDIS